MAPSKSQQAPFSSRPKQPANGQLQVRPCIEGLLTDLSDRRPIRGVRLRIPSRELIGLQRPRLLLCVYVFHSELGSDTVKSSVTVRDSPGPLRFDSPAKPTQLRLTGDRTLKVRKVERRASCCFTFGLADCLRCAQTTFDPVRDPELYALWAR